MPTRRLPGPWCFEKGLKPVFVTDCAVTRNSGVGDVSEGHADLTTAGLETRRCRVLATCERYGIGHYLRCASR